jgi:hypothetical protein
MLKPMQAQAQVEGAVRVVHVVGRGEILRAYGARKLTDKLIRRYAVEFLGGRYIPFVFEKREVVYVQGDVYTSALRTYAPRLIAKILVDYLVQTLERYRANVAWDGLYKITCRELRNILMRLQLHHGTRSHDARLTWVITHMLILLRDEYGLDAWKRENANKQLCALFIKTRG